ncbi:hypothetical protein ACFY7C_36250 [Streptomyces sp. NPDC012769]|uniref:hypothetical protein n=1 Tax=Streptomyces sp. NPDC012769 TaxID=3364848 RepID=UPI0036C4C2F8
MSEQLADERALAAPAPGQGGGRAVMLISHREPGVEATVLPSDHHGTLAAVRQAAGSVMARQVGEMRLRRHQVCFRVRTGPPADGVDRGLVRR